MDNMQINCQVIIQSRDINTELEMNQNTVPITSKYSRKNVKVQILQFKMIQQEHTKINIRQPYHLTS